jgi:hypothetical protein
MHRPSNAAGLSPQAPRGLGERRASSTRSGRRYANRAADAWGDRTITAAPLIVARAAPCPRHAGTVLAIGPSVKRFRVGDRGPARTNEPVDLEPRLLESACRPRAGECGAAEGLVVPPMLARGATSSGWIGFEHERGGGRRSVATWRRVKITPTGGRYALPPACFTFAWSDGRPTYRMPSSRRLPPRYPQSPDRHRSPEGQPSRPRARRRAPGRLPR